MMYELTEKNHQAAMIKFATAATQEEVLAIDKHSHQNFLSAFPNLFSLIFEEIDSSSLKIDYLIS